MARPPLSNTPQRVSSAQLERPEAIAGDRVGRVSQRVGYKQYGPRAPDSREDQVLDALLAPDTPVYLRRQASDRLAFLQHLGDGYYWMHYLLKKTGQPGGFNCLQTERSYAVIPIKYVDDLDASITYSGGGWTILSSKHRTNTAGDYAEWTSSATSTHLGFWRYTDTVGGVSKVTINGDATLATLCPTAQELVDTGGYPNTILVANGGTLNPTDRVMDNWSGHVALTQFTKVNDFLLAVNLAPAAYTVRFTATGYTRGTTGRLYVDKLGSWDSTVIPTTSGVDLSGVTSFSSGPRILEYFAPFNYETAWEYAHYTTIGGVTEWLGSVHGNETEGTVTIEVDDVPTVVADNTTVTGTKIEVIRSGGQFRHSNLGARATNVADINFTYKMERAGLTMSYTIGWQTTATIVKGYPIMMPVSEYFTRGSTDLSEIDLTLTDNDDLAAGQEQSGILWFWPFANAPGFAGCVWIEDEVTATNNWARSDPDFLWIQDRIDAIANKGYLTRGTDSAVLGSEGVIAGNVWSCTGQYRFRRLANPHNTLKNP